MISKTPVAPLVSIPPCVPPLLSICIFLIIATSVNIYSQEGTKKFSIEDYIEISSGELIWSETNNALLHVEIPPLSIKLTDFTFMFYNIQYAINGVYAGTTVKIIDNENQDVKYIGIPNPDDREIEEIMKIYHDKVKGFSSSLQSEYILALSYFVSISRQEIRELNNDILFLKYKNELQEKGEK